MGMDGALDYAPKRSRPCENPLVGAALDGCVLAARLGQVFRLEAVCSQQYLGVRGLEALQAAMPANSAFPEPQTGVQTARISPGTPTMLIARVML